MPSTRNIIQSALEKVLVDEDGNQVKLRLLPGLRPEEIDDLCSSLLVPPPDDVRDLLEFCSGIEGALDVIDFTGRTLGPGLGLECLIPHALPIGCDGCGNYWVVDIQPGSPDWGPIYYYCHDAPVILLQAMNVQQFVVEVLKIYTPPRRSLIDDVHEDRLFDVWSKNPGVLDCADALNSPDAPLKAFAQELNADFQFIDLRGAPIGMGFSWGRYGANTEIRRFGDLPIFAYRKPEKTGFFSRLFGP